MTTATATTTLTGQIDTRFSPVIVKVANPGPATFAVRYTLTAGGHLDVPAASRQAAERTIQGL